MNSIVKHLVIVGSALVAVGLAAGGGAWVGYSLGTATVAANEQPSSKPADCNLRLVWDRTSETYDAIYEDSVNLSLTGSYGPVANPSCTDAEMLSWRSAREAAGKPSDVCRPVIDVDMVGTAFFSACAVPTMVVSGEPR